MKKLNEDQKIAKIAEISNVPIWKIRAILGLEQERFMTFPDFLEAKSFFTNLSQDSEGKESVILKMIELAQDFGDIKYLLNVVNYCEDLQILAIQRGIILAENSEEAKDLYNECPPGHPIIKEVFNLWTEKSLEEIENSTNSVEAKKTWIKCSKGGPAEKLALIKWDILSSKELIGIKTVDQAKIVYDGAPEKYSRELSISKEEAFILWDTLAISGIKKFKTASEAEKAYFKAPPSGTARMAIINRWVDLANTAEDLKRVCMSTPFASPAENKAYKKFDDFLLSESKQTNSIDYLSDLVKVSFIGSLSEKELIKGLYDLL